LSKYELISLIGKYGVKKRSIFNTHGHLWIFLSSMIDRNLFEMKIFLSISIPIQKSSTSTFILMVETVFDLISVCKEQHFLITSEGRETHGENCRLYIELKKSSSSNKVCDQASSRLCNCEKQVSCIF
jgi:hypothetical protein